VIGAISLVGGRWEPGCEARDRHGETPAWKGYKAASASSAMSLTAPLSRSVHRDLSRILKNDPIQYTRRLLRPYSQSRLPQFLADIAKDVRFNKKGGGKGDQLAVCFCWMPKAPQA
jgi:hypothetical protein